MKGAGGTDGGIGEFLIGLLMMCGGFYLLLNSIVVSSSFGLGYSLYGFALWGGMRSITTGMVLIPFMFGVAMIFYNGKSIGGWLLACGSVAALIFGVITSLNFSMRTMSAFELLTILVLAMGGLGLFLKSLRSSG